VGAAVALENSRIIDEEGLVERVREDTGPYFAECLRSLEDHSLVGEVRSVGLMAGFELVADRASRTLFDPLGQVGKAYDRHAYSHGLIIRAMRDTIGLCPPLTISRSEIDALVEMARRALDSTLAEVGR
jgi:putrescine aminotransferase